LKQSSPLHQKIGYRKWITGGIGILFLLLFPQLFGAHLTTMFNYILMYSMVVTGLGLLIGWAGQFSLAQAAFYGVGAYTSALLSLRYNVNPWLGLLCSAALVGVIAYVLSKPLLSVPGFKVGFVTLGFAWFFHLIVSCLDITGGHDGLTGIRHLSIGRFALSKDLHYYYLLLAVVAVAFFLNRNLVKSKIGKEMRAIDTFTGGSVVAAKSFGINIGSLKTQIFVIAAIYASIAGSINAHYLTVVNPMPFDVWNAILTLVVVIIGGVHSLWGGILGAAVYFGIKEFLTVILGGVPMPGWQYFTFGVIVTLILLFFPEGIAGAFSQLHQWWNQRVSSSQREVI
jgi:branched-chain amino acid transport system permease protein